MKFSTSDEVLLHGDPAVATFDMLDKLFVDLRPEVQKVRTYALSSSPILIEASAGPELEMMGQAIHNGSDRKSGPYAVVSLSGLTNEDQQRILFGDLSTGRQGLIYSCNHGTLMIQGIDKLTLPMQSQLARLSRAKRIMSRMDYLQYKYVDVRLIGSTSKNLTDLRNHFLFRSDLLFVFRALRVRIPKLKERPNDVRNMLDFYFNDYNRMYHREHTLTGEARNAILNYPWETHVMQLSAFCERMVLTAPDAIITTSYVRSLFKELYESDSAIYGNEETLEGPAEATAMHNDAYNFMQDATPEPHSNDVYRDLIEKTLMQYHGNRKETARALGISTTTLWRKIKYYHLDE